MVGVSFFGSEEKIDWVIPDNLLALNPGKEGLDDASGMVLVVTVLLGPQLKQEFNLKFSINVIKVSKMKPERIIQTSSTVFHEITRLYSSSVFEIDVTRQVTSK